MPDPHLELTDWRRRVAATWAQWRAASAGGPPAAALATVAFRAAKDELFRDHPQTPLPVEARGAAFEGLSYWPYDPDLRLFARFEPAPALEPQGPATAKLATLPSSGGEAMAVRPIGQVALSGPLAGTRLSVFWMESYGGGLFLPFRDATSGDETYGAGRYLLDTIKGADQGADPVSGELLLDFNMAYFPSCAYDPRWACPLAPPENRLPVPVRVGERLPGRDSRTIEPHSEEP
jgi:uncharacterized protein (DUF1684 family)